MAQSILDQPAARQVLFHPRRDYQASNGSFRMPDVRLISVQVEPDLCVGGRLYPYTAEAPLILYYHGNGEIAADYDDIAALYKQIGTSLLVMDYRGYGTSDGSPTASNLLTDAIAVFEAVDRILQDHNLAPAQLCVMGRSLGSAAAIEIARHAEKRLSGLIVESGFADTFALLARLGVRVQNADEDRDGFGNASKLSQITTRTLIIHGQDDILIPASDGQELHRRCAACDKKMVLIPRAGHNDLMLVGMRQYFEAIRAFVHGQTSQ